MEGMAEDRGKNDAAYDVRLQEIAEMPLGALPDDEVLRLLAERARLIETKRIAEEQVRLEAEKEKAQELQALTAKKKKLQKAITELNQSITPAKADDELLDLVAKRKALEQQLEDLEKETSKPSVVAAETEVVEPPVVVEKKAVKEKRPEKVSPVEVPLPQSAEPVVSEKGKFGAEGIEGLYDIGGREYERYMDELSSNMGSLGTLLQNMPVGAKRNKAFMLKVAELDPAYAMHYADPNVLKKDEEFNIRVAAMKNPRNSGNALAEMLPEARTSKVVLAAVKQDYMNVKFVRPAMEDYDEILAIAKEAALEKIAEMKDAADVSLLIPTVLRQDKKFMEEVQRVVDNAVRKKTS